LTKPTNTTKAVLMNPALGFIAAALPDGIEASEARGAQQMIISTVIPTDMSCSVDDLTRLGFEVGDVCKDDPIFRNVKLPEGWSRESTDHDMHTNILDEKGRKRFNVFYKAAFYDLRANLSMVPRFTLREGWDDDACDFTGVYAFMDNATGKTLWTSGTALKRPEHDTSHKKYLAFSDKKNAVRNEGKAWADKHYPDWQDSVTSWLMVNDKDAQ